MDYVEEPLDIIRGKVILNEACLTSIYKARYHSLVAITLVITLYSDERRALGQ